MGAELERRWPSSSPEIFTLAQWRAAGVSQLLPLLGERGAEILWRGMQHLLAWAPSLADDDDDVLVHAPCIEGVGEYPVDDGSLQVAPGVWVVGDAGGAFRGIVASMISGRYAALRIKGPQG